MIKLQDNKSLVVGLPLTKKNQVLRIAYWYKITCIYRVPVEKYFEFVLSLYFYFEIKVGYG
jgi:hypothetical protein